MGHSKEQLDAMFPDRMAFSKFQTERVRERNELTQRLMNLNGMNDDMFGAGAARRVAGERDREYVLVNTGEDTFRRALERLTPLNTNYSPVCTIHRVV